VYFTGRLPEIWCLLAKAEVNGCRNWKDVAIVRQPLECGELSPLSCPERSEGESKGDMSRSDAVSFPGICHFPFVIRHSSFFIHHQTAAPGQRAGARNGIGWTVDKARRARVLSWSFIWTRRGD